MAQRTRNKIAQGAPSWAKSVAGNYPAKPPAQDLTPACRRILTRSTLKSSAKSRPTAESPTSNWPNGSAFRPPPCLRRVRTLEEAGYIQGYRGLLDPRRLGFDVTVFASVHLSSQADADLRAFEDFVRAEPLVRECWMLSGEVDFILKCVAPDMATFQDFVTHLTAAPHVRNVRTSLVLHNSKYEAAVPLEVKVPG